MPIRPYDFELDIPYHIYNRGNKKMQLFYEEEDYQRFLENIDKYYQRFPQITFLAYCILPNHFHFLLLEKSSPGSTNMTNISKYMNLLQQSYAVYFRKKYTEKKPYKGPVFEGRFQARSIEEEAYLEHIQYYVEYNAVKHNLVESPQKWPYSSFHFREKKAKEKTQSWILSDQFSSDFL